METQLQYFNPQPALRPLRNPFHHRNPHLPTRRRRPYQPEPIWPAIQELQQDPLQTLFMRRDGLPTSLVLLHSLYGVYTRRYQHPDPRHQLVDEEQEHRHPRKLGPNNQYTFYYSI